ncbi:uncharacterized protein LOC134462405 [Engraulis encrasicolus]|uniref:uncharacterized protein LOC134462405 n=1 Tax=Engraulis encrasicolus TaxID=184585 RepID=UPI002FD6189F
MDFNMAVDSDSERDDLTSTPDMVDVPILEDTKESKASQEQDDRGDKEEKKEEEKENGSEDLISPVRCGSDQDMRTPPLNCRPRSRIGPKAISTDIVYSTCTPKRKKTGPGPRQVISSGKVLCAGEALVNQAHSVQETSCPLGLDASPPPADSMLTKTPVQRKPAKDPLLERMMDWSVRQLLMLEPADVYVVREAAVENTLPLKTVSPPETNTECPLKIISGGEVSGTAAPKRIKIPKQVITRDRVYSNVEHTRKKIPRQLTLPPKLPPLPPIHQPMASRLPSLDMPILAPQQSIAPLPPIQSQAAQEQEEKKEDDIEDIIPLMITSGGNQEEKEEKEEEKEEEVPVVCRANAWSAVTEEVVNTSKKQRSSKWRRFFCCFRSSANVLAAGETLVDQTQDQVQELPAGIPLGLDTSPRRRSFKWKRFFCCFSPVE